MKLYRLILSAVVLALALSACAAKPQQADAPVPSHHATAKQPQPPPTPRVDDEVLAVQLLSDAIPRGDLGKVIKTKPDSEGVYFVATPHIALVYSIATHRPEAILFLKFRMQYQIFFITSGGTFDYMVTNNGRTSVTCVPVLCPRAKVINGIRFKSVKKSQGKALRNEVQRELNLRMSQLFGADWREQASRLLAEA